MKRIGSIGVTLLLAAALCVLTACGGAKPQEPGVSGSGSAAAIASGIVDPEAEATLHARFLDHPEYAKEVTNEEEALEALYSMMDDLGGDETTELVFHDAIQNAEDTVFYIFGQAFEGLSVKGGNVKLIVNQKGQVLGVNSTVVTGLQETPNSAWEISKEEAEQIVAAQYLDPGAKVLPNLTEQTILPFNDNSFYYVWIVYSNNVSNEIERPYIANYVTGSGEYLFSLPVSAPGNEEALIGSVSIFAFEGYEEDTWTGTVTDSDGAEREITVPVLIDPETGVQYLGDLQRKIICADCTDFDNGTLTPITSTDATWVNNEVITYEKMIRVWDFYDNIGWHGPDGDGTPTLILMNMLDENGKAEDNAFYVGKEQGFQVFKFNDEFGDGSCSDIVGHEFTHCLTDESLINQIYANDMGAINESFSDIMGNLIEMSFGDSPGGEWLFGERSVDGVLRDMKDPHRFKQPEFSWDIFYIPNSDYPDNSFNDLGGVHANSSLLSLVSYKLHEAGMSVEDQIYFWMNADFCLTSRTEYTILSKILPFVLDMCGYSQYATALDQAIRDVKMAEKEIPETTPSDTSIVKFDLPFNPAASDYYVRVSAYVAGDVDGIAYTSGVVEETRTAAITIPAGDYILLATLINKADEDDLIRFVSTPEGWKVTDGTIIDLQNASEEDRAQYTMHFEGGTITELETDSMAERLQ